MGKESAIISGDSPRIRKSSSMACIFACHLRDDEIGGDGRAKKAKTGRGENRDGASRAAANKGQATHRTLHELRSLKA